MSDNSLKNKLDVNMSIKMKFKEGLLTITILFTIKSILFTMWEILVFLSIHGSNFNIYLDYCKLQLDHWKCKCPCKEEKLSTCTFGTLIF